MSTQTYDLHRALLRPAIVHMLRAAGFHSTKPSVLDTVTNLAERYIMLLASSTATHARSSHNDPIPTITDLRMALAECGALSPLSGAAEEDWRERMRRPMIEIEEPENGGHRGRGDQPVPHSDGRGPQRSAAAGESDGHGTPMLLGLRCYGGGTGLRWSSWSNH